MNDELKHDLEQIKRGKAVQPWQKEVERETEKIMGELEQNPTSMMDYMDDDEQTDLLYEILLRERLACSLWDIAECIDSMRERIALRIAEQSVDKPEFPLATDDREGSL